MIFADSIENNIISLDPTNIILLINELQDALEKHEEDYNSSTVNILPTDPTWQFPVQIIIK